MPDTVRHDTDEALVADILASRQSGTAVNTVLETDAQVIARVTDGIYQQPASAFRELISNAYDADATQVTIQTDRPRFQRITVTDNGNGMGPDAVAHLIRHIGGSAKRSSDGAELGVTKAGSPSYSPKERRLIGKIGIGLFSVSQLTRSFQIVTKLENEPWRTIATVRLREFSADENHSENDPYEAGLVSIWQEPATDLEAKGTTIILNGLKPAARDALRSSATWMRVQRKIENAPKYHVGAITPDREYEYEEGQANGARLPWLANQTPAEAFDSFVQAITRNELNGAKSPRTGDLLDYYLQMVWQLSLAAPLPYFAEHPFDAELGQSRKYALEGDGPVGATLLADDASFADHFGWAPSVGCASDFAVLFDDLLLRRPLKFSNLPTTSNAVKSPMIFAGHLREEFGELSRENSGGPLEFYAYLMWTPKVIPADDVGSLIRIHGASGTGFDETFMKYQVAETTRLKQISAEIFVVEGLEAALNIDRESYNFAHAHVVRLTNWLHNALGRTIATQKALANVIRRAIREANADEQRSDLEELVQALWQEALGWDADSPVPPIVWEDSSANAQHDPSSDAADSIRLLRSEILPPGRPAAKSRLTEAKLAAIVQMLSAYDLLDEMESEDLQTLLTFVARVLVVDE